MSFLENLKSIFKINISIPKLKKLQIHIFSGNKNEQAIHIDNRTINININGVKSDDIPKLVKAINNSVIKEDNLLIEDSANKLLTDFVESENREENVDIIIFFRGKIDNSDLEILRASLYVKLVYERGGKVGDLKRDIILKFGERGRNIVNLCTAGYFTSLIKPLYNEMVKQPNFTPTWFLEVFDTLVNHSTFAVFVSSPMTKEQLLADVEEKMEINKKYGINYLTIHGIGENNVSKIEYVLMKIRDRFTYTPDIESGKRYIIITIYF